MPHVRACSTPRSGRTPRSAVPPTAPAIFVAAPYASLDDALPVLVDSPVEAIGLDLVRGSVPAGRLDREGPRRRCHRRPQHLARRPRGCAFEQARGAQRDLAARRRLVVHLAVPRAARRRRRAAAVRPAQELARVRRPEGSADRGAGARACTEGNAAIQADLDAASAALGRPPPRRRCARRPACGTVRATRVRGGLQPRRLRGPSAGPGGGAATCPLLPTTTIGSFPQTGDIRKARAALVKGELTEEQYVEEMRAEIRARRRPAGGDRPRRARARRARAQRHGAVLRRVAGRVRRHAERLGAVLRLALYAPVDPVGRRVTARRR